MRLWSIHPKYLDSKGLVALWREALLAQKVLQGQTKGYKNHPQLIRFKQQKNPLQFIGTYLYHVYLEAEKRGYSFDQKKILNMQNDLVQIPVTTGQKEYEFDHLKKKLLLRSPDFYSAHGFSKKLAKTIDLHPLFKEVEGEVESWEVVV